MSKYDVNKEYGWSPDDKFEISGKELAILLNSVRAVLSTEQAKQILLADRANSIIEELIARNVENDIIKELPKKED